MKIKNFIFVIFILLGYASVQAQEVSSFSRSSKEEGVRVSTDVGVCLLPVAATALTLINHDGEGFMQGLKTAGLTVGTTLLLKYAINEQRPDMSDWQSFPSGHTSISFGSAAFIQKRYGWKFGLPAYAVATYVGWGRVYARKHHWWDVVAGAAIGAGSAYLFTTPFAERHQLSVSPYVSDQVTGVSASITF